MSSFAPARVGRFPAAWRDSRVLIRWLIPLAVLAECVWLLLARLQSYPAFWFDEGYKANAARTLAELGRFATRSSDGLIPYDPGISGGPVDIAAMALSFKLFGVTVMTARAPAVLFGVVAMAALYGIVVRLYGPRTAALACLSVLAAPSLQGVSFVLLGRQALSEVPALSLLLCGLLVYAWAAPIPPSSHKRSIGLLAAGVLWGLAMLSRQQWALTFGPALLLWVSLRVEWRVPDWPRRVLTEGLPVLLMLITVAAWKAAEYIDVPAGLRVENATMALDAARTNLLTGLWGSRLTGTAWAMVVVMTGSAVVSAGWLRIRQRSLSVEQQRFHLFMIAGVLAHAVWFALLSVGWPRYAFPGLIFALVSLSIVVADVCGYVARHRPTLRRAGWLGACALLGVGALVQAPGPTSNLPGAAEQMAETVVALIPGDAVVETWEWEIGSLVGPARFHFPHQRYLFEAIRMRSHQGRPINLKYDVLQRNPEYLIRGPFEALAHVYDDRRVAECFRAIAVVEPYTLFVRSGCR